MDLHAVIDQLLPHIPSTERERLVLRLGERVATRLAVHWHALISNRAEPGAVVLEAPDVEAALPTLAQSLRWPATLALLADVVTDPTVAVLASPAAAVREAALEALVSDSPLWQFDQGCEAICKDHLTALLERLPPADRKTYDLALSANHSVTPGEPVDPVPAVTYQSATEPALLAALCSGDNQHAIRLLAAAALVPAESIETAISLRSRRGLVSLAWKAGFSMRAAVLLQTELGGFPASGVLTATSDGSCPLNRSEMVWQIGFLARKLI